MTNQVNLRELILDILLEVLEKGEYSHIVIGNVLDKYQFMDKKDRSFIMKITQGTLENLIQIDMILNQFSNTPVKKMKPVIRNILRMSVYQLLYMDAIPDSAICNEAVKLSGKRGFAGLRGFMNGLLRNIIRKKAEIKYPDPQKEPLKYLSVTYSMPEWILEEWLKKYSIEDVKAICTEMLKTVPTSIRCNTNKMEPEKLKELLLSKEESTVKIENNTYLDYGFYLSGYDKLQRLEGFKEGFFTVQDASSMFVGEIAAPVEGNYVIDVCAAPGGKSMHIAEKLKGTGTVEARDLTQYKVELIEENIERLGYTNIKAVVMDALKFDEESVAKADIVIADLPCSGLGVMSHKTDIKYKMSPQQVEELAKLQREILKTIASYVKVGGTLIYSTCTITTAENEENLKWFLDNFSYETESLNSYLPEELHSETTKEGYLQMLPGIHKTDGFFISRMRRIS